MFGLDTEGAFTGDEPSSEGHVRASVTCSREQVGGETRSCEPGSQRWGLYDTLTAWISGDQHVSQCTSRHVWGDSEPGSITRATQLTFSVGNMEQVQQQVVSQPSHPALPDTDS